MNKVKLYKEFLETTVPFDLIERNIYKRHGAKLSKEKSLNGEVEIIYRPDKRSYKNINNIIKDLDAFGYVSTYINRTSFYSMIEDDKECILSNNYDNLISDIDEMLEKGELINTITITFESIRGDVIKKVPKKMYHMTDESNLKSILRKGLIPKNKNKVSYHPQRVYLSKDEFSINNTTLSNNLDRPQMLEVNTKGLNLKLYKDPNMFGAYFTYDIIPPSNIKTIDGDLDLFSGEEFTSYL